MFICVHIYMSTYKQKNIGIYSCHPRYFILLLSVPLWAAVYTTATVWVCVSSQWHNPCILPSIWQVLAILPISANINREHTRTRHLEGRRWHIHFLQESKTIIVARATSLHLRQNSGIVNVQDVPLPEKTQNVKMFHITIIWYFFARASWFASFNFMVHLELASVRCLPCVLSLSPDIGTFFNSLYFLTPSCTLPSHPTSVMVTLREPW